MISLDTVRRDHLSLYGYERNTTPEIDRFAAGAAVFLDAVSQEVNTNPSHTSMFTGLYPHRHGSIDNGWVLRDDQRTLAELLGEAGFATGGFISGATLTAEASGLDRGFDVYDDQLDGNRRDGILTMASARRWLRARPTDQRYFMFVHLYDAHGRYLPNQIQNAFHSADPGDEIRWIPPYQALYADNGAVLFHVNPYIDRYDTAIHYIDQLVAALLQDLDLDDTAVVVLSDHGETFTERYWQLDHGGQLFDEQIRIPWIIHVPGFAPRQIGDPVEAAALAPTALELMGVAPPVDVEFQVASLVPYLRGDEAKPTDGLTFASAEAVTRRYQDRGYALDGDRRIDCVRSRDWKLIVYPGIERDYLELYRLEEDPGEHHDLAREQADVAADLHEVVQRWRSDFDAAERPRISDEVHEQLKALGYVD